MANKIRYHLVQILFFALGFCCQTTLQAQFNDDIIIVHKGAGLSKDFFDIVQLSAYYTQNRNTNYNQEHTKIEFLIRDEMKKMDTQKCVPHYGVLEIIHVARMGNSSIVYSKDRETSIKFLRQISDSVKLNLSFKLDLEQFIAKLQFPKERDNSADDSYYCFDYNNLIKKEAKNSLPNDLKQSVEESLGVYFPLGTFSFQFDSLVRQDFNRMLVKVYVKHRLLQFGANVYAVCSTNGAVMVLIGCPKSELGFLISDEVVNKHLPVGAVIENQQLIYNGCAQMPIWVVQYSIDGIEDLVIFDAISGEKIYLGDCDLRHDYYCKSVLHDVTTVVKK